MAVTEEIRASGHPALWEETLAALERAGDRSIVMTNLLRSMIQSTNSKKKI